MNTIMQLIDVPAPPVDGPARETRVLAETEGLKLVAITLRPGGELPDHVAPGPITVQVFVGRAAITVAGETQELAPGRIAVLAAGVHHALRQVGADAVIVAQPTGRPKLTHLNRPMLLITLLLSLVACGDGPRKEKEVPSDSSIADTAASDTDDAAGFSFAAPAAVEWGHFATAAVCADCHSNHDGSTAMRDAAGRPVAPFDLWGATPMANSARNPYWWAAVAAEKAAQPAHAAEIEAECMTCHAPALVAEARLGGGSLSLDDLLGDDDTAVMGLDGVTCTVCHQIEADGLGEASTFSGAYPIYGTSTIYGPYSDPFAHPMERHTGYTPTEGAHIREAGMCATCHTLTTAALDAEGASTGGHLLEQSPYLEWQNSRAGRAGVTCQDCHVPQVDEDGMLISTRIARSPEGGEIGAIEERSPYGRHVFLGANAFTMRLLRDNREALQPYASEAAFDEALALTEVFLGQAATLDIGEATRVDGALELPIRVTNLAGHKLPTGYPSRRMWLHVVAKDATGTVVFESGGVDNRGRIVNSNGSVRPEEAAGGPVFAHAASVSDGEVAVWQAVMADADGEPTFRLLTAEQYLTDDRILPDGWSTSEAEASGVASAGIGDDADFVAGSDTVRFVLPPEAATVEVELLYQSASPRHLAELYAWDDPLVGAFRAMVEAGNPGPERMAAISAALAR